MGTKIIYNDEELANFSSSTKVVKCKDNIMDYDLLIESIEDVYDGTVEDYSLSGTWVIDQYPSLDVTTTAQISFESNGEEFSTFTINTGPPQMRYLKYDDTTVNSNLTWQDDAYQIVTFFESPTGDLLTWLQANAVKQ